MGRGRGMRRGGAYQMGGISFAGGAVPARARRSAES